MPHARRLLLASGSPSIPALSLSPSLSLWDWAKLTAVVVAVVAAAGYLANAGLHELQYAQPIESIKS